MEQRIISQLEIIEKSNNWIKSSLEGENQKKAYRNFVNCRRKLNKKKFALKGNPAAALYGESQVGKSYLISSLLTEDGKPFGIKNENGKFHNFIEEINPPGGGTESTSLISRFSINYKPINEKFPIKAVLLSPADIVLVLCDSFYNDINLKISQNIHFLSTEEIKLEISQLKERFKDKPTKQQVFSEDDVLDMLDYFDQYFQKADRVIDSKFFDEISLLIAKTNPSEWKEIFSLLWNKNETFTTLFDKLICEYQKINFEKELYLPIESVLCSHGTLLDVKCLREIYGEEEKIATHYSASTRILLPNNNELDFTKSFLCALTAELIFSQPESLLNSKPFLKETDLLDFPGARSRLETSLDAIEDKTIPDLLLRGKVAYLFNKYSDNEKINILIFCAKHTQVGQRTIPRLIKNWVNKIVGDSADKREEFIKNSKISPLFVIGTFFNENLSFVPLHDRVDGGTPLNNRWLQRFTTTLEKEYFEKSNYSWFEDWTKSQPDFKNIFLLRDFEKSETPSNLFNGYNQNKKELQEVPTPTYPNFREKLRQSFLEYDFVKRHFENPIESWDEAASINKDGTKLIIDKLTIASNNINNAIREKTYRELNEISQVVLTELQKHFHSNDKDEELHKAKSKAGNIQFRLDTAFSSDGIKHYGLLMKDLMIDEGSVLELYRKTVDNIEHRDIINLDKYSTYRQKVPVLKDDTVGTYFNRLCLYYEKTTEEQKQMFNAELENLKIDLNELVSNDSELIKNNSQQLAETLIEYWFVYINLPDKHTIQQVLVQEGNSALKEITDMFKKIFKKIGLAKIIAEKIRNYVDGHNRSVVPYEIIADISAELLNKFVSTIGFEYLDESALNDLKQANQQNNLGLILEQNHNPRENSLEELFTRVENWTDIIQFNPEEMKTLPNYSNYFEWCNRLKVGFVSVCDIPNYDIASNEKLGKIIADSNFIKY
jgi:hypothetical protein